MRMVKFKGQAGRNIWVNPDLVCTVGERHDEPTSKDPGTIIFFHHDYYAYVFEAPTKVAEMLKDSEATR